MEECHRGHEDSLPWSKAEFTDLCTPFVDRSGKKLEAK
jgi:hypothetical protein